MRVQILRLGQRYPNVGVLPFALPILSTRAVRATGPLCPHFGIGLNCRSQWQMCRKAHPQRHSRKFQTTFYTWSLPFLENIGMIPSVTTWCYGAVPKLGDAASLTSSFHNWGNIEVLTNLGPVLVSSRLATVWGLLNWIPKAIQMLYLAGQEEEPILWKPSHERGWWITRYSTWEPRRCGWSNTGCIVEIAVAERNWSSGCGHYRSDDVSQKELCRLCIGDIIQRMV